MRKPLGVLAGVLVFAEGLMAGVALAADNFGAIATSDSGAYGYAYDYPTQEQAERAALEKCGEEGCQIQVWFKNACGAVAKDDEHLGWGWAGTRAQAEANAVSQCGTGACKVVTWACTTR
ncbi:DUF4189 domain-containing protein [Phormidium sp. LEGE 05292]|uniref:DUF4189 domain-containing protein n=1 Tax=[Phormidium] sp. LEGE 05292 TaxID=767427 RepID=UPI00187FD5F8|nr:DUF4189 domain-containing protein [Phormidium sp. LEGE 05292]MBE9224978.1 DUF4189 domain-containing protein [Phormidium sp. LEGE 05292]